jgi:hypothetical protein
VLDWTNDDQPHPLTVPGMLSVPYSVELKDQLDQLYADSALTTSDEIAAFATQ